MHSAPPSAVIVWPVMNDEASELRSIASAVRSSG